MHNAYKLCCNLYALFLIRSQLIKRELFFDKITAINAYLEQK